MGYLESEQFIKEWKDNIMETINEHLCSVVHVQPCATWHISAVWTSIKFDPAYSCDSLSYRWYDTHLDIDYTILFKTRYS